MEIYKIWALVGFVFLFIEIMTPSMFFLPLGGAAFFAAIAAFKYPDNYWIQGGMFALFAVLFYITAHPFMRKKETGDEQTGVDAKYIENEALVLKDIGVKNTDGIGSIKIYGEVWQAKSIDGEEIKEGEIVKIVKNESLIMYVEKISKE